MNPTTTADDRFEVYFTEKLWEMIPSIYRHEDGLAENPGVLRALVEVLAGQAATLRRSHDMLWDDQYIELCSEWAVPYIADLVATRILPEENKRGRRVDVAKTIYYRRRKGTLRVLEELISDISGWDGRALENFRRLARARHGLDPHPAPLAGRFSKTPPGGTADLRHPMASELAGGPFGEYHHTPDFRRHAGSEGRYNIPKLAFHLYRLESYRVEEATPFSLGDGLRFGFDPSGREVPLFNRRNRPSDWDQWGSALEWELPAPMRCRLLGHAEFVVEEADVQDLVDNHGLSAAASAELRSLRGLPFRGEAALHGRLGLMANSTELLGAAIYLPLLRSAMVGECGKRALLGDTAEPIDDASVVVFTSPAKLRMPTEQTMAGSLSAWAVPPFAPEKRLVVSPEKGRLLFLGAAPTTPVLTTYHYGFSGNIGAGSYDRRAVEECEPTTPVWTDGLPKGAADLATGTGVTQIENSLTYDVSITKLSIQDVVLQAKNGQRPYLRLTANLVLGTGANLNAKLALDGLWLGSDATPRDIVLRGDYECVVVRNCTLDPGDTKPDLAGNPIHPVRLVVEGAVEKLFIESSIVGPVLTQGAGVVTELFVSDSIVQSVDATVLAIDLNAGVAEVKRTTLFGNAELHRLFASELLATGVLTVTDTQNGCFRFSAARECSQVPRRFESLLFPDDARHWFSSRRFGQPGFGQLSETAPEALRRGAENKSEIGAFSQLINPILQDSLRVKVEEYMPFGLIPIFINET